MGPVGLCPPAGSGGSSAWSAWGTGNTWKRYSDHWGRGSAHLGQTARRPSESPRGRGPTWRVDGSFSLRGVVAGLGRPVA